MVPLWPDDDGWRPENSRSGGWGAEEMLDAESRLSHLVAAEVNRDPQVSGGRMVVTVQNGVVILEGCADSAETRKAAVRRVWATSGVLDVCNMLTIDSDCSPG
jgi:osmotically-inducible protein OsmY